MSAKKSRTDWARVRAIREDAPIPFDPADGPYDPNDEATTEVWLSQATVRRPGQRGPGKAPSKRLVSLRLSRDVIEHFRATGPGWQTRIDETLRKDVARQRKRKAS
jgi:uncharacterized protein (DUF4415 family)